MQSVIKHEWIYEQSPMEIWAYLTESELIALWLMPNNFKLIPGHEFQFHTNPMPALGLDGVFHCQVLSIEPFNKLSYSWKGGSGHGEFTFETVVEWTLEPHGKGTRLILNHAGFKESNIAIFTGMQDGWLKKIQRMLEHLTVN